MHGDLVTPVVLQKIQPLVVVGAGSSSASGLPHFGWFLVAGLVGTWLIAFPNPFDIHVEAALPALYAITAAVLWAFGTVLGRLLATRLRFQHVTALRFFFGLPASAVAVLIVGAPSCIRGRHVLDRRAGRRHRPGRALALLLRAPAHAGRDRGARRAHVPGHRGRGRLLRVRRDARRLAVARRRSDDAVVLLLPITGAHVVRVRGEKLVPATS